MSLLLILIASAAHTAASAALPIIFGYNRSADAFHLLVLLLDLLSIGLRVRVEPGLAILQRIHDFLLLLRIHLLAQALVVARPLGRRSHRVDVTVKGVPH